MASKGGEKSSHLLLLLATSRLDIIVECEILILVAFIDYLFCLKVVAINKILTKISFSRGQVLRFINFKEILLEVILEKKRKL